MSLTQCGSVCDVGGEYILLENMGSFRVAGIEPILHFCESHEAVLKAAADVGQWQDLPDGPLRRAFEAAMKENRVP